MSRTKARVDMVTTGRPMWPGQWSGPWTHLRIGPGSFFLRAREARKGPQGPASPLPQDGLEAASTIG